jgi:hypothetical protein
MAKKQKMPADVNQRAKAIARVEVPTRAGGAGTSTHTRMALSLPIS